MAERFTPQFRVENTAGGEPNLTREFTPNFNNTNFIYRGVMNTWIGDGDTTTRPENNDAGVLYVEYKDGTVERLGPVSSYAVAVANGFDGTEEEWEAYITSVAVNAQAADERALDAEAWAVGKRDGTDVPSTDDTYHNNSKYYSEQSATSATNAATSELNASGSATTAGNYASNALNSKNAAAQSESNAEAWAVGKRGGVDVGNTDATYENNAKYYAQLAGETAVDYEKKDTLYGDVTTTTNHVVEDARQLPVKEIVVTLAPHLTPGANSDPGHFDKYDYLYIGHGGKNLIDVSGFETTTKNDVTFTGNGDGSITVNGTPSSYIAHGGVVFAGSDGVESFGVGNELVWPDVSASYYSVDAAIGTLHDNVTYTGVYYRTLQNERETYSATTYIRAVGTVALYAAQDAVRHPSLMRQADYVYGTPPSRLDKKWIYIADQCASMYGGTYNVTTGRLTVTHGHIASYAGEELPGVWASNMDTYVEGTLPSTGAEVVYELSTSQQYEFDPFSFAMLGDYDQVWANACTAVTVTGYGVRPETAWACDLSLKYYATTNSGTIDTIIDANHFLRKDISKDEGPVTISADMNDALCIKDLTINSTGTAPSENQFSADIDFLDKNDDPIGNICGIYRSRDRVGLLIRGIRKVDNTYKYNGLDLVLDDLGNPVIVFDSGATQNAWKTALDIDDLETAVGTFVSTSKIVDSNSTSTLTFSGFCSFCILISGAGAGVRCIIMGHCTLGGSVTANKYSFGSVDNISINTDTTNKIKITNGADAAAYCRFIRVSGSGTLPT